MLENFRGILARKCLLHFDLEVSFTSEQNTLTIHYVSNFFGPSTQHGRCNIAKCVLVFMLYGKWWKENLNAKDRKSVV